jgi:hypothetical protein
MRQPKTFELKQEKQILTEIKQLTVKLETLIEDKKEIVKGITLGEAKQMHRRIKEGDSPYKLAKEYGFYTGKSNLPYDMLIRRAMVKLV